MTIYYIYVTTIDIIIISIIDRPGADSDCGDQARVHRRVRRSHDRERGGVATASFPRVGSG